MQNSLINGKLVKAQNDIEAATSQNDKLHIELNQESTMFKLREADLIRVSKENMQLLKIRESLQKKLVVIESEKAELIREMGKLK